MYADSQHTLFLSIKDTPVGKPTPLGKDGRMSYAQSQDVTYNWRNVAITPADLIAHNTSGKPLAIAHFTAGHRLTANFIKSNLIALDFDGGVKEHSLDGKLIKYMSEQEYIELLNNPFIQAYAFAVIQSASSKPGRLKARILIRLDRVITDAGEYSSITRWIVEQLPGADHTTDAARFFYGGLPGRAADFVNTNAVLEAAPICRQIEIERQREKERREKYISQWESGDDLYKEVQEALRVIPTTIDYGEWLAICASVYDSFPGHEGVALIEGWSPGYAGEVERKFKSFRDNYGGRKATIASVFYRAMSYGYQRPRPPKQDIVEKTDIDNPPASPAPICLTQSFREFITEHYVKMGRQDNPNVFLNTWEALLNAGVVPEKQAVSIEEAVRLTGLAYQVIYRVFNGIGIYLQTHTVRKGEQISLAFEFVNKSFSGTKGRPTHLYTIPDPRPLAKRYGISLVNAQALPAWAWGNVKHYTAHLVNGFTHEITTRLPLYKFEDTFQMAGTTISKYLKLAEELLQVEITRDQFIRKPLDDNEVEDVVRDMLHAMATSEIKPSPLPADNPHKLKKRKRGFTGWLEMFTYEDGVKVPYLHKGGKSGKPNNRIPISLAAVKRFIDKAEFELVIRTSNLYRRLNAA